MISSSPAFMFSAAPMPAISWGGLSPKGEAGTGSAGRVGGAGGLGSDEGPCGLGISSASGGGVFWRAAGGGLGLEAGCTGTTFSIGITPMRASHQPNPTAAKPTASPMHTARFTDEHYHQARHFESTERPDRAQGRP